MTATNDATALFRAFLACLVVASLPIKNLAYITPALYLLILWLHGERRVVRRTAVLCSTIALISSVAILWDHLGGRTVNFPGIWFGLLTYLPLIVLLCESFSRTIDYQTYDKFVTVCSWFILLQSIIGALQFVATRNCDAVCGSFGLLDGFRHNITIAQVYFTFTIFGMILFLIPVMNQGLPRVAIATGALACVLAQSGHQTIFFVVALVGCALARVSHLGTLARMAASAVVMMLLVLHFYPDTAWSAGEWYKKVTDTSQSPKWFAFEGAASILEEPKNMLIGTGLGQYSSRAALMTSGEYLTVAMPAFLAGRSDYFNKYIEPSLVLFNEIGEGSAMAKPYMSAINLPVEFGLVLTVAFLAVVCRNIIWCGRLMIGNVDQPGWIGYAMMVGILFFVLCCFIENYAEFSQGVFVPFILFVAAGSRARTLVGTADAAFWQTSIRRSYALAAPVVPR